MAKCMQAHKPVLKSCLCTFISGRAGYLPFTILLSIRSPVRAFIQNRKTKGHYASGNFQEAGERKQISQAGRRLCKYNQHVFSLGIK